MRKLAILIPTLESRRAHLNTLLTELDKLIKKSDALNDVHIIVNSDNGKKTIGQKRNELLEQGVKLANYVAFFDDDDMPGPEYIKQLMRGISMGVDCCSLRGVMLTDGKNPELFEHSIRYNSWATTKKPIKYERYPNHLNCISSAIASQFKYKEVSHGEDRDFSDQLHRSGLIKKEYFIKKVIYIYQVNTKK